ncbi:type I secretion system permease/ATPase [Ramlibacter alkalitolerans]|uniref:Type I secretion system permease/ATPase n=1 Tax=Ramlibacter alkalitolerans TaxID=2039631 RepID=A0ABS1JMP1_9BURK|nr:type I secretion system permease/ATPase [Ramlibacter alkalitolerans]MBL0425396.1 type I secretion system permease/ATPase [Ramlibacter alkalitolerans]
MRAASHARQDAGALLRPFRREFAAVGVFSGVANLLLLAPTIYMLQVYDRVLVSQSELTLLAVSVITLFLFAVLAFAEGVRSRVLVRTNTRLDRQLGTQVFNASFEASLRETGHSPARSFADLAVVRQFLTGPGVFAFFDLPWVPIYLGVSFFLHPMLGWVSTAFAVLQVLLALFGHQRTAGPAEAAARSASEGDLYLQAKLRHAETLDAMGMLPRLRARWRQRREAALALHAAAAERNQRIASLSKFVRYTQQSLTLAAGALLVIDGQLTPGAMIAANVLAARALAPIDHVVGNWRAFVGARGAWQRLRGLLQSFPLQPAQEPRARPAGAVRLRGLTASAPGRATPILRGIDLDIEAGQTLVILGPSGSGKSTLARCLVGIWPDAQGEVLLDGRPLAGWNREALGPHVGYLPQDVELFDGSVAENIARMAVAEPAKVIAASRATGLHDAILRLPQGYDTPIGEAGGVLSGGQRQRLALARALYGDPALLVLDEPNAYLDDAGELALLQAMRELRRQGRTLVLVTHRLPAPQLADRVLVLRDGAVAAYGPPAQVLSSGPAGGAPGAALPQPA